MTRRADKLAMTIPPVFSENSSKWYGFVKSVHRRHKSKYQSFVAPRTDVLRSTPFSVHHFAPSELVHKGVIEVKSQGRRILSTDFYYANGSHNAMTNLKTDIKINNFLNFITIFFYKNLLNFTFNILRMQSKQLHVSKYLLLRMQSKQLS